MEPIKPIARWSDASVGDTVRLDDGRCVLVGDVNELGGLCDDCMEQSNPVAVVTTRADFDALAAEAADARTLRAERDSLVKERDEAREIAKVWEASAMTAASDRNDADALRAMLLLATARADKAVALLREARRWLAALLKVGADKPAVDALLARIDALLEGKANG